MRKLNNVLSYRYSSSYTIVFLLLLLLSSPCITTTLNNPSNTEIFNEELFLRPLSDGKIQSHFQFTITWNQFSERNEFIGHDNYLFPKAIAHIAQQYGVDEFHISFTQGRWNYKKWGYPLESSPTGVELFSWFGGKNESSVDKRWRGLTNALSGIFCGSIQFLADPATTSFPKHSFSPYSNINNHNNNENLRYGVLPRESICTENLTPFTKLLPCRSNAGLGYLLNPLRLYDVYYHSMATHVTHFRSGSKNNVIQLTQTLTVVIDPAKPNWNLIDLFGRTKPILKCPLANVSSVYFVNPVSSSIEITPVADYITPLKNGMGNGVTDVNLDELFNYNLNLNNPFDLKVEQTLPFSSRFPPVLVHRQVTGFGGERGGLATKIFNLVDSPIKVIYYSSVPWYFRMYFHTLKMHINETLLPTSKITPQQKNNNATNQQKNESNSTSFSTQFHYLIQSPAELRSTPSILEFELVIPSHSTLSIEIDFEKAFLHYTEHPPDSNHGFDIGAAVVVAFLPFHVHAPNPFWSPIVYNHSIHTQEDFTPIHIYTENLLVSLPTPDFSMLYNVVALTCTAVFLLFGSILNLLIKRWKKTFDGKDFVSDRPIVKIIKKVANVIRMKLKRDKRD